MRRCWKLRFVIRCLLQARLPIVVSGGCKALQPECNALADVAHSLLALVQSGGFYRPFEMRTKALLLRLR